jgi:hypothetical protein
MKKNNKKPALLVAAILFTAIGLLTTTGNAFAQSKSLHLESETSHSGFINPPNAKNESFLVLFTDIENIEVTADANGIETYHYDDQNGAYVVSFHAPPERSAKFHEVTISHPDYQSYSFRFPAMFDTGQTLRVVLKETTQRSSILSEALSSRGGASATSRQQQPRANDSRQSILSGAIASGDVERRHQLNEAERERQRIEEERQRRERERRDRERRQRDLEEMEMRERQERERREREATAHINHELYVSEDRNIQTAIGIMNAVASAHQQNQQTLNRQQNLAREMTNRLNQQHQAQQQREERERVARQRQIEEQHRQEQNRQIQQQEVRQRQIEQDRRDREAQQQRSNRSTATTTTSQTPQRQISLVNRNQNNGQSSSGSASSGNTTTSAAERSGINSASAGTGRGTECSDRANPQWPAGKYSSGVFEVDGIGGMVSPGGPRTYHYGRIENYETDGCGNGWVRYEIRYQINPPAARPYSRERLAESGERFIISVGRRIANMLDNDINNHRYVIDQTRTIDSHVGMQEKDGRIYTTSVTGSIWIKATWLRN